jgi:hypothetical protein
VDLRVFGGRGQIFAGIEGAATQVRDCPFRAGTRRQEGGGDGEIAGGGREYGIEKLLGIMQRSDLSNIRTMSKLPESAPQTLHTVHRE